MEEMRENWINGNRKDVVEALIKEGKLSNAILFADTLMPADRATLVKMLRNREQYESRDWSD